MTRSPHQKYAKLVAKYNGLLVKLGKLDDEIKQLLIEVRPSNFSEVEWSCALDEFNEIDPIILANFAESLKDEIRGIEATLEGDET